MRVIRAPATQTYVAKSMDLNDRREYQLKQKIKLKHLKARPQIKAILTTKEMKKNYVYHQ
jgi:hypothetical protein